jgi:hypothetical protein
VISKGCHRDLTVSGDVNVSAEPIHEAVRLNRIATRDDEWKRVANFQNVLQQSPVQGVQVHSRAGNPSVSSGNAASQTSRITRPITVRSIGQCLIKSP